MKRKIEKNWRSFTRLLKIAYCTVVFSFAMLPLSGYSQLCKDPNKFFGCTWYHDDIPAYFTNYFNQITSENGGKWGSIEYTRDVMDWNSMQTTYDYCYRHPQFKFKHHCFIWGQQYPEWAKNLTTKEQWLAEIDEWYNAFKLKFPDPEFIDVVNEPVNTPIPALMKAALGGSGSTGYDWIVLAFQKARNRFPNAKLLINEFNMENGSGDIDKLITIVNILKNTPNMIDGSKNLINGIGLQAHFLELTNLVTVAEKLDKLRKETGVDIYISELDLSFESDQDQLTRYRDLFPILWGHPSVKGLTLWGFLEGHMWESIHHNAFLVHSDGSERPAMSWLRTYLGESSLIGKTIRLRRTATDNTYRYVTCYNQTDDRQPMNCNSLTAWLGTYEQFKVVDAGYGKIALQCVANNRYVSDEMGSGGTGFMTCNRTYPGDWEKFAIVPRANGKIALQGHLGKFVSHEGGTNLMTCNRHYAGNWEEFNYEVVNTASLVKARLGQDSTTPQELKMNIYPNPAPKGEFNLELKGFDANTSVSVNILDINGKSVYNQAAKATNVLAIHANLSRGLYFVMVSSAQGLCKERIVVK